MSETDDWRVRECEACEGTGIHSPNGEVGHPEYALDCPVCKGECVVRVHDEELESEGQLSLV